MIPGAWSIAAVTVDDLATITADIWSAFLLAEGAAPLAPTAAGLPGDEDLVHATVAISGAWTGQVALALTEAAAARAARRLLAVPEDEEVDGPDVDDAVGELANMVGGNVKGLVPAPSTLGLPEIDRRPADGLVPAEARQQCVVDLDWDGVPVRVGVWRTLGRA